MAGNQSVILFRTHFSAKFAKKCCFFGQITYICVYAYMRSYARIPVYACISKTQSLLL